jgi:hypothetical protein
MFKTTKLKKTHLAVHFFDEVSGHNPQNPSRKSTEPFQNFGELDHNKNETRIERLGKIVLENEYKKIQNMLAQAQLETNGYESIKPDIEGGVGPRSNSPPYTSSSVSLDRASTNKSSVKGITSSKTLFPLYNKKPSRESFKKYRQEINQMVFKEESNGVVPTNSELKERIKKALAMSVDQIGILKEDLMTKICEENSAEVVDSLGLPVDENYMEDQIKRVKAFREYGRWLRKIKKIDSDSLSDDDDDNDGEEEYKKWLIYPNSPFIYFLNFMITILTLYTIMSSPLSIAFTEQRHLWFLVFDLIVDIIFIIDCAIHFFIPYVGDNDALVTSHKKIAIDYLLSWFTLDFLAGLPVSSILGIISPNDTGVSISTAARMAKLQRLTKVTTIFKVAKFFFKKKKDNGTRNFMIPKSIYYIGIFFFYFVLISHVITCMWIYVGTLGYPNWIQSYGYSDAPDVELYIHSLYYNWVTIFTIGYGDITAKNSTERIFTIMIMMFGLVSYSFALSSLGTLLTSYDSFTQQFIDNFGELQTLRRNHRIPDDLYIKILKYLNYDFKNNKNEKFEFFNELPSKLKHSLMNNMYNDSICNFKFLKFDNDDFKSRVIFYLRPIQYNKREYIVCENEYVEEFLLLRRGTINITLGPSYGKDPIMKISRYEHFGDILILGQQKSPVNLRVSTRMVDLFIINKKDLVSLSLEFPKIFDKITLISMYNYITMLELMKIRMEDIEKEKFKEYIKTRLTKKLSNSSTLTYINGNMPLSGLSGTNLPSIKFSNDERIPLKFDTLIMAKEKLNIELVQVTPCAQLNTPVLEKEHRHTDLRCDVIEETPMEEFNSCRDSESEISLSTDDKMHSQKDGMTDIPKDVNSYIKGIIEEKFRQMGRLQRDKFERISKKLCTEALS